MSSCFIVSAFLLFFSFSLSFAFLVFYVVINKSVAGYAIWVFLVRIARCLRHRYGCKDGAGHSWRCGLLEKGAELNMVLGGIWILRLLIRSAQATRMRVLL